jgi:hypothetical protein
MAGPTFAQEQAIWHAFMDCLSSVIFAIFMATQAGFSVPAIYWAITVDGIRR